MYIIYYYINDKLRRLMWENVLHLESLLNQLRDSPYYRFYGTLVYSIKALGAINMPHNMSTEISQCTHIVAQLCSLNTDPAEQIWLARDFEYLHYTFTRLQGHASDYHTFDLTLEVLDNLVALTSQKKTQGAPLAFYGNLFGQSQSTINANNNVTMPQVHNNYSLFRQ